jgi:peroxiredoxin
LRGIENNLKTLSDAGIRTVAISVDSPEINREYMLQKAGYTFTFLSDPKLEAIRRYDLVHAGQGVDGADIARPAEFLIDPSGTIRWRMMTENLFVRARPEQILEIAKSLQ